MLQRLGHVGCSMRDPVESGSILVQRARGRRMNVKKLRPLDRKLIVDDDVWLWEKRGEVVSEAKLLRALPCVVCPARTPAIEKSTVAV